METNTGTDTRGRWYVIATIVGALVACVAEVVLTSHNLNADTSFGRPAPSFALLIIECCALNVAVAGIALIGRRVSKGSRYESVLTSFSIVAILWASMCVLLLLMLHAVLA